MGHPEYSKVGKAGKYSLRVLIPKRIAKDLEIKADDELVWIEEDGAIKIEKEDSMEEKEFEILLKEEVQSHWDVFEAFRDARSIKAIP